MNSLVIGTALAFLVASPALAQSFDPPVGSGNIVPPNYAQTGQFTHRFAPAFGAFASVRPFATSGRTAVHANRQLHRRHRH